MDYRTLILVDGENLVARYEAMLSDGRAPRAGDEVIHEQGRFLWRPGLPMWQTQDVVRVTYFTTVIGDEPAIAALEDLISRTGYEFVPRDIATRQAGFLCPRVFKKPKANYKNKSVDLNIAIDALRHAYSRSVDRIVILSGDGDFVPLIEEVMRQGVQVVSGGFSNGLSPNLSRVADEFIDLDPHFLDPTA